MMIGHTIRGMSGVLLVVLMDIVVLQIKGLRLLSSMTYWCHLLLILVLHTILSRCTHLMSREHMLSIRVSLGGLL